MKNLFFLLSFTLIATLSFTQETQDTNYLEKVKTLDSTIETLYSVISGDAGVERDWALFRYLFKPDAKLIPTGKSKVGSIDCRFMSPDDYVSNSGEWLVKNGFHEIEVYREVQTFGNITQVFSYYEAKKNKKDLTPFMKGINSIQLLHDGLRWWIINIYWQQESETSPLPDYPSKETIANVERACLNYLEGFYEGDTLKIKHTFKTRLNKFGFYKNDETGKFEPAGYMTFNQAMNYASNVLKKKKFPKKDAPKEVEILDIEDNIATAKVTAWWGVDYLTLSKEGDKWFIEQVLWQGL